MKDEKEDQHIPPKFFRAASHDTYSEPEPILDPSCDFEKMDRGEGMAVDDEKTYHREEK